MISSCPSSVPTTWFSLSQCQGIMDLSTSLGVTSVPLRAVAIRMVTIGGYPRKKKYHELWWFYDGFMVISWWYGDLIWFNGEWMNYIFWCVISWWMNELNYDLWFNGELLGLEWWLNGISTDLGEISDSDNPIPRSYYINSPIVIWQWGTLQTRPSSWSQHIYSHVPPAKPRYVDTLVRSGWVRLKIDGKASLRWVIIISPIASVVLEHTGHSSCSHPVFFPDFCWALMAIMSTFVLVFDLHEHASY